MRQTFCHISSICRLTTLLLILLVYLVAASQVFATYLPDFNFDDRPLKYPTGASLKRRYMLWNKCSQRFVRIKSQRKVDARGNKSSRFAEVEITSVDPGVVTIKNVKNQLYLCFNKHGRLRAKNNPKKHRCHFFQNQTVDGYVHFYLKTDPENDQRWYIGFKKNGKALPGYKKRAKSRLAECFDFNLRESNPRWPIGPIDFNKMPSYDPEEPDTLPSRQKARRIRHFRRRNKRRRMKKRRRQRRIDR